MVFRKNDYFSSDHPILYGESLVGTFTIHGNIHDYGHLKPDTRHKLHKTVDDLSLLPNLSQDFTRLLLQLGNLHPKCGVLGVEKYTNLQLFARFTLCVCVICSLQHYKGGLLKQCRHF